MASYYVVKESQSSCVSTPLLTAAPVKPYVAIKSHGYIALTSDNLSLPGTKVKISSSTYRFVGMTTEEYTTTSQTNTTSSSTYTLQSTTWRWAQQGTGSGTNGRECGAAIFVTLKSDLQNVQTGPYWYQCNCALYGWITLAAYVTQGSWFMNTPIWAGFLTANGALATYWSRGGPAGAAVNFLWTDSCVVAYAAYGAGQVAVGQAYLTASIGGANGNTSGASGGNITVGYGTNTATTACSTSRYGTSAALNTLLCQPRSI